MYRKFLFLIILALFVVPLSAHETDNDLIAYFNEQLYIMENDALVEYDACVPDEEIIGQFIPSPDNTSFLIATFPKIISEALALFGSLGDSPLSANFWLCDTTTDSLERIIVQPGADDPFADSLPEMESIMGQISWSPDGTQLAWTELDFIESVQYIVIYDLETGETSEFEIDVPLAPFPGPADLVAWTDEGIILWVFEFNDDTFFNIETMFIIDVETQAITAEYEILNGGESDDFYVQRELVYARDGLYYAIEFQEQGWVLVDIATGEMIPTAGRLALISPNNAFSLELQYEIDFEYNYNWEIFDLSVDENPDILRAYPPERMAISGDGLHVAYADSTLHIYDQAGGVTDIANSDGFADDFQARLIWGSSVLTLVELDEAELAPPSSCQGAPQIRLAIGDIAIVLSPTVPNRIRSLPSTDGAIVGEIPGGFEFIVRDGPVCEDVYTWFLVEYEGVTGWTAEGTGQTYFVEPISDLP